MRPGNTGVLCRREGRGTQHDTEASCQPVKQAPHGGPEHLSLSALSLSFVDSHENMDPSRKRTHSMARNSGDRRER